MLFLLFLFSFILSCNSSSFSLLQLFCSFLLLFSPFSSFLSSSSSSSYSLFFLHSLFFLLLLLLFLPPSPPLPSLIAHPNLAHGSNNLRSRCWPRDLQLADQLWRKRGKSFGAGSWKLSSFESPCMFHRIRAVFPGGESVRGGRRKGEREGWRAGKASENDKPQSKWEVVNTALGFLANIF